MQKFFFYSSLAVLILLSMPALKLGESARMGQLAILATFILVIIHDIMTKKLDYKILLFFFSGAAIMALISVNSIEVKFGESKFFIKYFLIFPASFYIGYKFIEHIPMQKLILLLEIAVFVFCFNTLIIDIIPLPDAIKNAIVVFRSNDGGTLYVEYQGTFAEAGWFAMATEATALSALLLRYDFAMWPKNKSFLGLLYVFVFVSLVLSKNKTVWIALVMIALFLIVYKAMIMLARSNYYMPCAIRNKDYLMLKLSKFNTNKILFFIILFILTFLVVNTMLSEPIISNEMLAEKMKNERGKAFMIVMNLIRESDWFGGYGFGFVEAFFSLFPQDVIGLGEGSGMIFNSYLDVWLSVSIFGLIFHLLLLYFSSSSRYYLTMVIPLYFFIYANFNPAIGDEYYYIFLGISYGVGSLYQIQRREIYA